MVHTRTKIERSSMDIIKSYKKLSVATVYEASGRKRFVDPAIKPISRGTQICGSVITVQCASGDNLMLHKALQLARKGDVLVVDVGGAFEYGYWGELMATSAMASNIAGLVIDGCIRDSAEIIEMGFPVFCRGFSVQGTIKQSLGLINYPMVFGRVSVNAGDLILGNDDGLVIVKYEDLQDVLDKSLKRVMLEEEKTKQLSKGVTSVEMNNFDKIFENLGYEEE